MRRDAIPHHGAQVHFVEERERPMREETVWRANVPQITRGHVAKIGKRVSSLLQMFAKDLQILNRERPMTITMDSNFVPPIVDLSYKSALMFRVLSDQKKRCLKTVFLQHIQHTGCIARMRTIIEGERDFAM